MESITSFLGQTLVGSLLQYVVFGGILTFSLYLIGNEIVRYRARISGLKGPRGLPIVGNLFDIYSNASIKYQEWAKEYGDVYQVQLGNTGVVVVNSAATAKTLFMSNSQALSSRPMAYTFHKVMSC